MASDPYSGLGLEAPSLYTTQGAPDPRRGNRALSLESSWVLRVSPHPRGEASAHRGPSGAVRGADPTPVGPALGNLCLLGLGVSRWGRGQDLE